MINVTAPPMPSFAFVCSHHIFFFTCTAFLWNWEAPLHSNSKLIIPSKKSYFRLFFKTSFNTKSDLKPELWTFKNESYSKLLKSINFVDNDFYWTPSFFFNFCGHLQKVTSHGHFLVNSSGHFCPREVPFLGEFLWTLFDGNNN